MTGADLILAGVFALGIILNAFFAGYETGFVSCNRIRVRHLADKENNPAAKLLQRYLEHSEHMITLVLIGTNLSLVMGTVAFTKQAGPEWATLVATPMFLIFGEVVPKSMFRALPTRSSLAFLPLIRFFDMVLAPLVVPAVWLSDRLLALMRADRQGISMFMRSAEDVRVLVDESADQGAIEPEEQEMIHSVMNLQKQLAKEVMVPRIDVRAVPITASREELITLLEESGHTRIPVYGESIDEIIGIINAFDVLKDKEPPEEGIRRYVKDTMHVPDTIKLDDALQALRKERQHMAIVTDEYGGTDGVITIEDILEEIFGEIHDEYDKAATTLRRVGPGAYVIDARMPLEDAAEAMGLEIEDEDVETVGGWVMHVTGRIPGQGEVIEHGHLRITVLAGGANFVSSIRLEIRKEASDE